MSFPLSEQPGQQIGAYRLIEPLGEGGFGVVWRAEQSGPLRREVALKLLKLGMNTRQVIARFEAERQALALMSHPGIAAVFDAGATETGLPYFAMELVKGAPLTAYCDERRLAVRERVALLRQVCLAVQHAHERGVVHRDLKPSNVLVAEDPQGPQPKVIDFGIAKATGARLTDGTQLTEQRQMLGTLDYMAPEQALADTQDLDARADVYSLGVMLYELLTGARPFDLVALASEDYSEVLRTIREVDAPRPSTRITTGEFHSTRAAHARKLEVRDLQRTLRGELDWIAMRALEKERERRYPSAQALADDLQRFLDSRPVQATPPSTLYRARKFAVRNRVLVSAAGAVFVALSAGLAFATYGLFEARRESVLKEEQRARAVDAEREQGRLRAQAEAALAAAQAAENDARRLAEAEAVQRAEAQSQRLAAEQAAAAERQRAEELRAVAEFQRSMLDQVDAVSAGLRLADDLRQRHRAALERDGLEASEREAAERAFAQQLAHVNATDAAADVIVGALLGPASATVSERFAGQPLVAATLRQTLADTYMLLGRFEEAAALQEAALAAREEALGREHPQTLVSLRNRAQLHEQRGELEAAERDFRSALAASRRVHGERHADTIALITGLSNVLRERGQLEAAEELAREGLELARATLGDEARTTLIALNVLGQAHIARGGAKDAEPLWREACETGKRVFGSEDRDVVTWTHNLGGLLGTLGRPADSEPYLREALEGARRLHGEQHPDTLQLLYSLAHCLQRQGRYAEAEPLAHSTHAGRERLFGRLHPATLASLSQLGSLCREQGRHAEAEPYLREVLLAREESLGAAHPDTISARAQLAQLLNALARYEECEALFLRALEDSQSVWPADHPDRLVLEVNFGSALMNQEKYAQAEPHLRAAFEGRVRTSGPDHPETLIAQSNWGALRERQGQFAEAEQVYRDAAERFRHVLGTKHPNTLTSIGNLARTLLALERAEEAETLYREVLEICASAFGPAHTRTLTARTSLGRVLLARKLFAQAQAELLAAEQGFGAAANTPAWRRRAVLEALVQLYDEWELAEPGAGHAAQRTVSQAKLDALGD